MGVGGKNGFQIILVLIWINNSIVNYMEDLAVDQINTETTSAVAIKWK